MAKSGVKLKPDSTLRRKFYIEESFSHPAKMHIGMFQEILARYDIQPGSLLLDPMAGSGTCLLACLQGINVIANEMELHFLVPMLASWQKIQVHGPMLGYQMGQALIIRGDARSLPLGAADCVVTSPPYENAITGSAGGGIDWSMVDGGKRDRTKEATIESVKNGLGGYTRPDAIITSPPYADMADAKRHPGDGLESEKGHVLGYTRPDVVVTSPPYEGAETRDRYAVQDGSISDVMKRSYLQSKHTRPDVVVTSPPWENQLSSVNVNFTDNFRRSNGKPGGFGKALTSEVADEYGTERPTYDHHSQGANMLQRAATYNIGNLRSAAYWEAMFAVYQECHRVLKDAGLMILVVKGYTRDHEYVDLPQQTIDMVETLGFKLIDRWERELWSLSFWRILQARKHGLDERLKYETVIAFRKEQP